MFFFLLFIGIFGRSFFLQLFVLAFLFFLSLLFFAFSSSSIRNLLTLYFSFWVFLYHVDGDDAWIDDEMLIAQNTITSLRQEISTLKQDITRIESEKQTWVNIANSHMSSSSGGDGLGSHSLDPARKKQALVLFFLYFFCFRFSYGTSDATTN